MVPPLPLTWLLGTFLSHTIYPFSLVLDIKYALHNRQDTESTRL